MKSGSSSSHTYELDNTEGKSKTFLNDNFMQEGQSLNISEMDKCTGMECGVCSAQSSITM